MAACSSIFFLDLDSGFDYGSKGRKKFDKNPCKPYFFKGSSIICLFLTEKPAIKIKASKHKKSKPLSIPLPLQMKKLMYF